MVEPLPGDFDLDGDLDHADLDMLVANIALGPTDPVTFDLTGDGFVSLADRDLWLAFAGLTNLPITSPYRIGDANLYGLVDAADFDVWTQNRFTHVAAWSSADFNADGAVDLADLHIWNQNKFTGIGNTPTIVSAGPEWMNKDNWRRVDARLVEEIFDDISKSEETSCSEFHSFPNIGLSES